MRRSLTLLLIWLSSASAIAANGVFLEVSPRNRADLDRLFTTLEESLTQDLPADDPVVIILHGEEAHSFTRENFQDNRRLIDRAALLDAYQLIDMRMCETWMKENDIMKSDIPAFIDTVPFAPEEIERLEAEGYVRYDSVRL